jgi:hypothetical protein
MPAMSLPSLWQQPFGDRRGVDGNGRLGLLVVTMWIPTYFVWALRRSRVSTSRSIRRLR